MLNSTFRNVFVTLLLIFVFLFIYTKIAGPIPFSVQSVTTNKSDLFQVEGTGKASAAPDTAKISVGVTQSSTTVLDAQEKANQTIKKLTDGLKGIGISEKDIKTTNYSINPDYSFGGTTQRIQGYTGTQNLEVKVPIGKANQAVDVATEAGANLVGQITFDLDDDKKLEIENLARKEAVEVAKKKAKGLADASGIRLGKIINVSESFNRGGPVIPLEAKQEIALDVPSSTPTQITPGESNIEVAITLTYETF